MSIFLKHTSFKYFCIAPLLIVANAAAVILYPPELSQDSIMVGDRIELRVSIIVAPGVVVEGPQTDTGLGKFIVKGATVDKSQRPSSDSLAFHYLITLYTTEQCTIPSLPYILTLADSSQDTVHTEPVPLRSISIVTSDTAELKDLKPQQITGRPSLVILWILLALIGVAAAVWFGKRWLVRRKKPAAAPPPKPPYEEAIEALTALDLKQFLQKGMVREYVFELTEILKRYIGRRFDTNAADSTTEEMLSWLERAPIEKAIRRTMDWFFTETDPVKFAKHIPGRDTIDRFGDEARGFIEKTRPVLQSPEQAKSAIQQGGNGAVQGS